jgi:uncharacterized protein (UPF0548 family)
MQLIWRFLGQKPRLEKWESRPIAAAVALGPLPGDARDLHERVVAQEASGPPEPEGAFFKLAHAIKSFRVFPESVLQPLLRREPVEVGDTVGGCYHLAPGIDLVFASRVTSVFDQKSGDNWRAGFTYQTLRGHPELGEETFSVEKDEASGRITVALCSWSRPGTWLTWLIYRYARRCQLQAGRAALDHLGKIARQADRRADQEAALNRSK